MDTIDKFNELVGLILIDLQKQFPVSVELSSGGYLSKFVDEDDYDGSWDFLEFFDSTIYWLERAGIIWVTGKEQYQGEPFQFEATLSDKGLELLKSTPSNLEVKESFGKKLKVEFESQGIKAVGEVVRYGLTAAYLALTGPANP